MDIEGEEVRKRQRVKGLLATGDETLLVRKGCSDPRSTCPCTVISDFCDWGRSPWSPES